MQRLKSAKIQACRHSLAYLPRFGGERVRRERQVLAAVPPSQLHAAMDLNGDGKVLQTEEKKKKTHTCILRDFSRCAPVFFAMRERARAMREQSCAVRDFAIFAIFRDFSLALALRSRSLRSRSLAHRASRKIQVCRH